MISESRVIDILSNKIYRENITDGEWEYLLKMGWIYLDDRVSPGSLLRNPLYFSEGTLERLTRYPEPYI